MKTIFGLIFGLAIFTSDAHAYLDGGTGGMIVQLLLGGFAVAGAFIKMYWYKIKSWFKDK